MGAKAPFYVTNPFAYFSLLVLLLLVAFQWWSIKSNFSGRRIQTTTSRKSSRRYSFPRLAVYFLFFCTSLSLWYEYYYAIGKCSVSSRYQTENLLLASKVYTLLQDNGYCFWLDYGTLLSQVRGENMNPWEHDSDFSLLHPDYAGSLQWNTTNKNYCPLSIGDFQLLPTLEQIRESKQPDDQPPTMGIAKIQKLFQSQGYPVYWRSSRNLLQIGPPFEPHVDLWFWIPIQHGEEVALWTADHDTTYNPRRYSDIFPLDTINNGWIHFNNVPIPHTPKAICQSEYGILYQTPLVRRYDCFRNLQKGRIWY